MPFGKKTDAQGRTIDFDAVYRDLIAPAIDAADMEALRADEESGAGIIHKPMFERLALCDFAIADLTSANPNVFYELGVRHAVKPHTTLLLFAEGGALPFDVRMLRALPYRLQPNGTPEDPAQAATTLGKALRESRAPQVDSPLYQLLNDYPNIQHEKTDVFRQRVDYAKGVKRLLATARKGGLEAVRAAEAQIKHLADAEAGILVDLLLSFRACSGWADMVRLVETFPRPLSDAVLVREQQAFALNRMGRGGEAEAVLRELIRERGPSSETCGLLGRVYKDRWRRARAEGDDAEAEGWLRQAIDTYRLGFEADWRDAYPGINLLTLMECQSAPDPARTELHPVVLYAARRRAAANGDYWDHATLLELAVLRNDEAAAKATLGTVLSHVREPWEPQTTADNLDLILQARKARGIDDQWCRTVVDALRKKSAKPGAN